MEQIFGQAQSMWQDWGVFFGVVIVIGTAGWVYYDSRRRGVDATVWKVIAVIAVVLVLPSLFLKIPGLGGSPNLQGAVAPLGILGIVAGFASLIMLVSYVVIGLRVSARCPNCGREWLDPDWPHCPYCGYGKSTPTPAPMPIDGLPVYQPAPTASPAVERVASPRAGETMLLGRQAPTARLAWLVARSGPRSGKEFRLEEVSNIGRDASQNDIVLDDDALSRQHARIKLEGDQYVLYDLASANGTFVKEKADEEWQRIQKCILKDHASVKTGETVFGFMQIADKTSDE